MEKKDQTQIHVNRDGKLDNDRQREKKQGPEQPIEIFSGALLQVADNQIAGEKSEAEMNVLGDNVIPRIEWDEVDQVEIHRKIGKGNPGNLDQPSVFQVELGNR